jgi:hypothetical protein
VSGSILHIASRRRLRSVLARAASNILTADGHQV